MGAAAMSAVAQILSSIMGSKGGQAQGSPIQPLFGNIGQIGARQQQSSQGQGMIAAILQMLMKSKTKGGTPTQYGAIGGESINSSNIAPADYYLGNSTGLD